MDAKAKVVASPLSDEQVVIAKGLFIYEVDYSPEENWRGVRLDNVRKLIDKHEAEMAELQGYYETVQREHAEATNKGIAQANAMQTLLTDHESALAEQAKRHAATEIDACNWASRASAAEQRLARLQYELSNARRAKATLLTGLEALAGEWDAAQKKAHPFGYHEGRVPTDEIRKLIRTLTNSAKGGE